MTVKESTTMLPETDPTLCAKRAHLKYVTDSKPGFTRKRHGKTFFYYDTKGQRISTPEEVERINKIGIPPAYRKVWICPHENGHIQATGLDARGRKQYRYHTRWKEVRDENKFGQMIAFGTLLPAIRKKIEADLKLKGLPWAKVMAAVVKLLDITHIRIGNEQYAKENNSYGLTTMLNDHVDVQGTKIHFEFIGKSGQEWELDIRDKRLADIIKQCESIGGQALFNYIDEAGAVHEIGSDDVNHYLKDITDQEITAKYFRTWAGTVHAAVALQQFDPVTSVNAAKKNMVQAVKQVAQHLGNTPAVCKKSYIHPHVMQTYLDCKFHECWCPQSNSDEDVQVGLSCEESAVLSFLKLAL